MACCCQSGPKERLHVVGTLSFIAGVHSTVPSGPHAHCPTSVMLPCPACGRRLHSGLLSACACSRCYCVLDLRGGPPCKQGAAELCVGTPCWHVLLPSNLQLPRAPPISAHLRARGPWPDPCCLCQTTSLPCSVHSVLQWIPPNERAKAVSLSTSGMYLGSAGAMLVLPSVAAWRGAPSLLRLVGCLGLLWLLLWSLVGRDAPHRCRH